MQYHTKTQDFSISERDPCKRGAEGSVYIRGETAIKLFHTPSEARSKKLDYLVDHRPSYAREELTAWPQELVYNNKNVCCGYTMRVVEGRSLSEVLERFAKIWDREYLLYTALSLIRCVDNLHAMHVCIGDFNPNNFVMNIHTGDIIRVDIDSLHIEHMMTYFPCNAIYPEHGAPEIFKNIQKYGVDTPGKLPKRHSYTKQADWFALYIIVFRLLNQGVHPCCAQPKRTGEEVPMYAACIQQGIRPYFVKNSAYKLPAYAPPLKQMPRSVRELFQQCFGSGFNQPLERPSAKQLYTAIAEWYADVCRND